MRDTGGKILCSASRMLVHRVMHPGPGTDLMDVSSVQVQWISSTCPREREAIVRVEECRCSQWATALFWRACVGRRVVMKEWYNPPSRTYLHLITEYHVHQTQRYHRGNCGFPHYHVFLTKLCSAYSSSILCSRTDSASNTFCALRYWRDRLFRVPRWCNSYEGCNISHHCPADDRSQ